MQGIGHKAQLRRHSEAVPPRQAHGGGASEGRRLREPDGALPFRSAGPPRDGRSALSAASSRNRRLFAVDLIMRPGKAPMAGSAFRPGGEADSDGFPHKKWAPARANAQNRTRFLPYRPASPARPRARRACASGNKKEGPAVSGGPLGNPWWSLGGSNPWPHGCQPCALPAELRPLVHAEAPCMSATPCPPAAWRCSTFGEGGLNCRVRNGIG